MYRLTQLEMEVNNLGLTKSDVTQKLLGSYATDEVMSDALLEALLEDPYNPRISEHMNEEEHLSKTARIARAFFKCAGFDIYDDNEE